MNRIEELISELCPEGVPYPALGEVGEFFRGRRFVKDDIRQSGVPAIHYGELYTKYSAVAYEAFSFLDKGLASKLRVAKKGDVILVSAGETIADIGKSIAWLGEEDVVIHDALYGYRSPLDAMYVSYFFNSPNFRLQLPKYINSSKVSAISPANLSKITIPVPPIEVQREIVRILDNFRLLESELVAELGARTTQFAYILDQVFDNENIRKSGLSKLADHGDFDRGNGLPKSDFSDVGVGCIHYGQIYTKFGSHTNNVYSYVPEEIAAKLKKVKSGNLVITTTSENIQDVCKAVAWLGTNEIVIGGHSCVYRHKLDPLFATYLFRSRLFQDQKNSYVQGTKVKDIKPAQIGKIEVYVPPMKEQIAIGQMMKNFDALITDTMIGLPGEITARNQQYEFYLSKLLNFDELEFA